MPRALHRHIRRFAESNETTKEIVQEAFLRTYRERDSVKTLRAFLFSTAKLHVAQRRFQKKPRARRG
jgi:DNA-directed RNA polymerase specialized sigma24 family protein